MEEVLQWAPNMASDNNWEIVFHMKMTKIKAHSWDIGWDPPEALFLALVIRSLIALHMMERAQGWLRLGWTSASGSSHRVKESLNLGWKGP